jgi:predicted amidophosphoribosyltransferase
MVADALAQYHPHCLVCDVLQHTPRDIPKQALIKNRAERLANKHGAYSLPEKQYEQLKGKHIILIDDVSTTGATLIEARRALANAAPASIQAWTLGH